MEISSFQRFWFGEYSRRNSGWRDREEWEEETNGTAWKSSNPCKIFTGCNKAHLKEDNSYERREKVQISCPFLFLPNFCSTLLYFSDLLTLFFFFHSVSISNGTNENLLPNTFGCARLRNLDRAFADFAAKIHNPSLEPLDSKLAPICGGAVPRVDGHPRLNGILDTVKAASAHGIKVDPVFTEPQIAETLEKAVCAEWFSGYQAEGE